mmetsp:Transcript_5554/g.10415  ORF Transcript_5554/g.10415 Transcript_5554/m.10415 type:complete len:451 (-) Transcript_5554:242-1594(-)|eukprot:CAMPEP_0178734138 /NCGR_PEP_ID=MMETSP0744-20121128/1181_1 /TAXON_ID=913974 /ORGANISM="Nitzschia punctata, Strain CCMP561" /LENGTH=450 /DNA_ID=CAMNT_0020386393 /DNA_START=15 /DNA_END=1367 /DNA_ORIENTATION=+
MDAELAELVKVVTPGHEEWEERRSRWNLFGESEVEVRLIAVPKNESDVVKIVDWARQHKQTDLGVRSGGHGFFSATAVVIDMREGFAYIEMDDITGIATIGMGNTLKQVDEGTAPYHVPLGVVSHTGCGLLLTGGVGYQTKAHGTSADNIVEVTIVTSDGTVHVCSEDQEPDLFFAVRGAAPNLGVVTQVKAKTYKLPDAFCTLHAWPSTYENLKRLVDWADQEAVLTDANITPYIGLLPSPDYGAHLTAIHVVCIGNDDAKYKELIGQLEGMDGDIELLPAGRVPFSTPQTIFDASFPKQYWYVSQNHFPADAPLDPAGLKAAVEAFNKVPLNPTVPMVLWEQRGSLGTSQYHAFASDSCAQPRHGQRWEAYIFFGTADKENSEIMRDQGRQMKSVIQSYASAGGRCHFTKDEPGRLDFYYGSNTERLRGVANKYDKEGLFATCNGMEF